MTGKCPSCNKPKVHPVVNMIIWAIGLFVVSLIILILVGVVGLAFTEGFGR